MWRKAPIALVLWLGAAACLLAQPAATTVPSSAPAAASGPAGLAVTMDERTGQLRLGEPPAPLMEELLLFDGKKTAPAPPTWS